jgi:hypothetical protein
MSNTGTGMAATVPSEICRIIGNGNAFTKEVISLLEIIP